MAIALVAYYCTKLSMTVKRFIVQVAGLYKIILRNPFLFIVFLLKKVFFRKMIIAVLAFDEAAFDDF